MTTDASLAVWSGRPVVVTGGTGFIGANLVRRLLSLNAEVHLLVRQTANWSRLAELRPQLGVHVVDLLDRPGLTATMRSLRPDCCFHLASYGSSSWDTDQSTIIDVVCHGAANVVAACRDAGCPVLVNVGSSSEYGAKDHPPQEDELVTPNSAYAIAKVFATHWCQLAAADGSLHAPTARLYNVYGPWESTRRFIPALLRAALAGNWPPLVSPDVARDFVYVDDVVDLLLAMAQRRDLPPDAVYNVGTGVQTTIGDAVALTQASLQVAAEPSWGTMPNRNWDVTCWIADSSKAQRAFSWQPRDFATGLQLTAEWLRNHPNWQ